MAAAQEFVPQRCGASPALLACCFFEWCARRSDFEQEGQRALVLVLAGAAFIAPNDCTRVLTASQRFYTRVLTACHELYGPRTGDARLSKTGLGGSGFVSSPRVARVLSQNLAPLWRDHGAKFESVWCAGAAQQ